MLTIDILATVESCVIESYPEERKLVHAAFERAHEALINGDKEPAMLILWGYAPQIAEEVTARW